ncbi:MAG: hypothetical protein KAI64_06050 [Thermoplasmata archaeon]|nr:hypothetical protein [Thermoplasmata archaeon]
MSKIIEQIIIITGVITIIYACIMITISEREKKVPISEIKSFRIIEADTFYHMLCIDGKQYFSGLLDGSHKIIRVLEDGEPMKCLMTEEE